MIGFFKFQASVKATVNGIMGLISPASVNNQPYGSVPNQIFSDAYIIGFLQSFSTFWMQANRGKSIKPQEQLAIFAYSYEKIIPKHNMSVFIKGILPKLNEETHPFHQNYMIGRNEGQAYVNALQENNEVKSSITLESFTNFIKKNYIKE